jgi:hypothetical protein
MPRLQWITIGLSLKGQHLQEDLSKVVLLEETPIIADIVGYETYKQIIRDWLDKLTIEDI